MDMTDLQGLGDERAMALEANALRIVPCNPALIQLASSKRVLLLQGPSGPFFDRLTRWLQTLGTDVHRVAFQGGDRHDSQQLKPIEYQGSLQEWPAFFGTLIRRLRIECVVLFGQSRKYHEKARQISKAEGLPVVVLEEGYFRPGFITMELGGVNGYSTALQRYRWEPDASVPTDIGRLHPPGDIQPDASPGHFQKMAWHAAQHYVAMRKSRAEFANYVHHRIEDPHHYAAYWLRSWCRKLLVKSSDLRFQAGLLQSGRPYFLVPLQHDGDAQITHHSPFAENTEFIIHVMRSFARRACSDSWLVFRQHPHSRGGPGHAGFISSLATELGIFGRVHHMVEGDTPELAEQATGVVVINSTVGLQALERGAPVMALGGALYKQPQLTFPGELDSFWKDARPACKTATSLFLAQIKNLTQAPVSVYAMRSEPILWGRFDGQNQVGGLGA